MFTPESPVGATTEAVNPSEARQSAPTSDSALTYPFRLLPDEVVLGAYPIARADRPLGKLASYLFVTDARLVYSAEAKTITSSSTASKEFHIQKVDGLEVERHTGFDSLGAVAIVGSALNFLLLLILGLVLANAAASSTSSYGYGTPFLGFQVLLIPFGIASLVMGIVVALIFRKPRTAIRVLGPDKARTLSEEVDLPRILVLILLFLVFGLFIGVAIVLWGIVRELGIFRAADAEGFAPPSNVDRISYEAGALILDVKARGTLAGRG